jgi:hypothetical protein
MAKTILMEEFHVAVQVPANLPKKQYASMRRTLKSNRFQTRLRAAVANVFRRHPSLTPVKFSLSR